jgi:hypothetical protein
VCDGAGMIACIAAIQKLAKARHEFNRVDTGTFHHGQCQFGCSILVTVLARCIQLVNAFIDLLNTCTKNGIYKMK